MPGAMQQQQHPSAYSDPNTNFRGQVQRTEKEARQVSKLFYINLLVWSGGSLITPSP